MNALKQHLDDRLSIYVLVIILSGLMFYYNLVYVPTNERKLNEHALRIIENKARILKDKYAAYQTAMSSAQLSYFVYWYFTLNPDVKKVYYLQNNGAYYYSDSSQLLPEIRGATIKTFTYKEDFTHVRIDRNLIPQINGPQQQGLDKDIWKVRRGDFYFVYSPDPDFIQSRTRRNKAGNKAHAQDTVFQYFWLKVKGFTANIKSNDFYEDIFLLRDTNDKLKYDQKNLEVSAFDSQILDESKLGLVRLSLPDNAGKLGVGVYDEKIFGQDYKVYYKLVKLKKGLNVYVLGLVTTSNFQKYARQIPTWFLVFCSLGILILILLFPVLKLFFLNEHERLSALDARLSVFSVVMCASLILMVLAGNYIFWVSEQQKNDASLLSLSNSVQSRFKNEVKQLRDAVSQDGLFNSTDEKENTVRFKKKHKEVDFNEVLSINKDGNINTIFFSDTTKRNNVKTLPVRLSDRDYYKIMRAAERNGNELDYQIEAINSLTTGKGEAAICIPLKTNTYNKTKVVPGVDENGSFIRVITSTLHSIINTRIPSPYKFAIVDRTGEVKFNSESKEVFFENFTNECSNDRMLAAYFENEIEGYVDFNYLRADCRGYIQPLGKGWSLVVYFEMGNSRGFAAQVFSLCLITLVIIALYVLFVQLLLATDNKKPVLLKTRAFFYDWLNPNNNTPEMWLSLAVVNASLFVLEMVWLYFSVSTVLTIIFLFIVITTSYYIVYTKLSGFRKNYDRIKSYRFLRWLLVAWIIIFIVLHVYFYVPAHVLILLPIGIILMLAFYLNHSSQVIKLRKSLASSVLKKYNPYRAFLFSWLLILAIGPSTLFVTDHFAFQNFVRSYAYLLEDVKKLQIKSVSEQEGKAGSDYTSSDTKEKYLPLSKDNPDFTFYSLIPRYSMHDASVTGVQFNYIPNYTQASISVSPHFVKIEVPRSNLTDNKQNPINRTRSLHTPIPLFEERTIMLGITTLLALLAFIWTMREIPSKIFFMPVSDFPYPDHYPPRDFSKNEIEREFENDDLDKHPLKGLTQKNSIIAIYNGISICDDEYKKRMDTEVLLLQLQQAAESRYKDKWDSLSDPEKFLLYDLADDGVTNQTETSLFNKLSEKGLLRLYPKLEVVNTSFANYVKTIMPKETITEWQKNENKNGRWNNLRIALIIIIIAAFAFLSVAEEDFLGRVSALLASVAVAVPNLVSAVGKISKVFIKE